MCAVRSCIGYVERAAALLVRSSLTLLLGVLFVLPIGGADMPVVISLLNSFTGLAAAATGFVLDEQRADHLAARSSARPVRC